MININELTPFRSGRHKEFRSSENKCVHIAKNPNGCFVRQFRVDGDVYAKNAPTEKCDFLLLNDDGKCSYYIELKGSDIEKAIRQIDKTILDISPGIQQYSIQRRIVYRTGSHSVNSSKTTRWKRKYGKSAIIAQGQYTEVLSDS